MSLEKQKQPAPRAILRSLNDLDGDFELQAAAAGGSNGVLVPPWLYEGKIAVTNAAQSPFQNCYPRGKVGVSVAAGAGEYRIAQSLYPRHSRDNGDSLHLNLDFRVAAPDAHAKGLHRFGIGAMPASPAVEVLISSDTISLRIGETIECLGPLNPNQWHNLQLALDLRSKTASGAFRMPGNATEFSGKQLSGKQFSPGWAGVIDLVVLDSLGQTASKLPAIEFDNLGVQDLPISPASTELPMPISAANELDPASLPADAEQSKQELNKLLAEGPVAMTTTAERLSTTVPTQALFFLNDSFVHAKAEKWAARLQAAHLDDRQWVESAWRHACGRLPTEVELAEAAEFLAAYRIEAATVGQHDVEGKSLAAYLRAFFGSNEFLHLD